jgi:hypothetical protein
MLFEFTSDNYFIHSYQAATCKLDKNSGNIFFVFGRISACVKQTHQENQAFARWQDFFLASQKSLTDRTDRAENILMWSTWYRR